MIDDHELAAMDAEALRGYVAVLHEALMLQARANAQAVQMIDQVAHYGQGRSGRMSEGNPMARLARAHGRATPGDFRGRCTACGGTEDPQGRPYFEGPAQAAVCQLHSEFCSNPCSPFALLQMLQGSRQRYWLDPKERELYTKVTIPHFSSARSFGLVTARTFRGHL